MQKMEQIIFLIVIEYKCLFSLKEYKESCVANVLFLFIFIFGGRQISLFLRIVTIFNIIHDFGAGLTDEIRPIRIHHESSEFGHPFAVAGLHLLVQDSLEVGCHDILVEVLEVDVVVDQDGSLAEGLNVDAVKGVTDQGVPVGFGKLEIENKTNF